MIAVVKMLEDITVADIVTFFWIEAEEDGQVKYVRGRRRTLDESIALCNGDVKRFMNYVRDYEKMS